jgi:hypothetical protein
VTRITLQDGKVVLRDGRVGTEEACCCEQCDCFNASPILRPAVATNEAGLVTIEFEACFGNGASGTVEAPPATNPCDYAEVGGAITSVTITNGGSGYALLGRVEPTISATVAGGSGATFSVSLAQELEYAEADGCVDVPYWVVDSVEVTAAGSGYSDGAEVTFSAAAGDTTIASAAGRAYVEIDEPVEQFSITSSGSGAVLEAVWEALPDTDWLDIRTPNPCPASPKKTYRLMSVNVVSGGSGYSQFDFIEITFASPADGAVTFLGDAYIAVGSVDGNGAITSVFVAPDDGNFIEGPAGRYVGSETDRLASVVVNSCVANGQGHYYREDDSEPAYVAPVLVIINQQPPSSGSGAELTAVVDDDPDSGTFGQIVSVTVDAGGDSYVQPSLCNVPENIFITWAGETIEVPLNAPFTDSALICGEFGEGGLSFDDNCRPSDDENPNGFPEDIGNTRSLANFDAVLVGGESLVGGPHIGFCACDKRIHVIVRYSAFCQECVPRSVEGVLKNAYRDNIAWRQFLCFRFELDEDGCPVGDGVFVSRSGPDLEDTLGEYASQGFGNTTPFPCIWYEIDGGYTSPGPPLPPDPFLGGQTMALEDCPCDRDCFSLPGLPTVSFMPS